MRRPISLVASLGLLLAMAIPAGAAVDGGPPCADIDNLLGNYDGTDGGTDADMPDEFGVILKAPSCARYTYTVYVFDEPTSATPIFTFTIAGNGSSTLGTERQITSAEDPDGDVYIFAESWFTNGGGNRVILDRAPDEGFALATIDGVTPGTTVKAG